VTLRTVWPAALAVIAAAGCGGDSTTTRPTIVVVRPSSTATTTTTAPATRPKPRPPSYPQLLGAATGTGTTAFVPVARWQGQTAAWVARTGSVSVLSFDQRLVELRLHAGTGDPGGSGWRFGPAVTGSERGRLVAAFNGGFKLSTRSGGYVSYGRVAAPLRPGLGSIVTYSDGSSDIGAWHREVPAPGRTIVSVRQNLQPLIDAGAPASNVGCRECWGATLGGVDDPARAGLGITADGRLIWAAGEHLTVSQLANALAGARVVRAVELDINPEWVAGYLYGHRGGAGPVAPVPVLADQHGIAGEFLAPWSRDFFSVEAR
jgi:hypothetical protein